MRSRTPLYVVPGADGEIPRVGTSPQQRLGITLVALVAVLSLLGSVMVLSASSVAALDSSGSSFAVFIRQCIWLVVGAVGFVVGTRIDYRHYDRWVAPLVLGALGLLVLVLVPGVGLSVNGAQRWIGLGELQIQPAEPAKFALVVFCASLVARHRHRVDEFSVLMRPVLVVLGLFATLLMLQPNLGTTAVLVFIVGGMLLWAGVPLRVLGGLGIVGAGVGLAFALSAPYRRARVTAFLDPWADASDTGYQTIQSLIGVASGGVTGTGLGESRAKWGFLPEAHTDFVFAIIGEELGLLGSLVVLALFASLVACGLLAAARARDAFGTMLAVGISTWFAVQAFVNVAAVLSLLPITGVPLPFVSFGGSSLLATMFAAGVLVNVAVHGHGGRPASGPLRRSTGRGARVRTGARSMLVKEP